MSAMTDETQAALKRATEALASARGKADAEKAACLAQIAADLPARAADSAKRIATEQPEVTKALGKEGVAAMRAEFQTAAEALGQQFVAAADEIKWPLGDRYSKVDNRHVHSALFECFYRHTGALTKVLSAHGYTIGKSEEILPQYLYSEAKFAPLAAALTELGVATAKLEKAKKDDDNASVDDLWGD